MTNIRKYIDFITSEAASAHPDDIGKYSAKVDYAVRFLTKIADSIDDNSDIAVALSDDLEFMINHAKKNYDIIERWNDEAHRDDRAADARGDMERGDRT